MPADHVDLHPLAEEVETPELIVDQCLEGTDVENRETRLAAFGHCRENRQECGLSLAGGGGRGDQDVTVRLQDDPDGSILHIPQFLPVLFPYPALHRRMEEIETRHRLQSRRVASSSSLLAPTPDPSPTSSASISFATSTPSISSRH